MKKRSQAHKRWISAKPGATTAGRRRYRRGLCSILVLGTFLTVCSDLPGQEAAPMTPAAAEFTFEQYEVAIGPAQRQTVLTGFLLGGAIAELAVVNIDENQNRRLRVYAFGDSTWTPRIETTLRPDVLFLDVANIGGRDRLLTCEPGRLNRFDPESGTEHTLVEVHSNFNPPRKDEIPHVDISRDVNGDERDDLVIPAVDGFWVFIQMSDGAFAVPVKIGHSTDMSRIYGADGYRYDPWSQSRIHEVDYNQDGRTDLVFWKEDSFEVHTQDERGLFDQKPKSFTTEIAFDSDDLSLLTTGDMAGRVLHSLTDLNDDGVADLVVFSLQGRSASQKHSSYEVHFGAPTADGATRFDTEIGATFQSEGSIQLGMDRHDFDGDGQLDLMVTTIAVKFLTSSLWKRIKGAMGDDVWLELEFYRSEGGVYPDEPNTIRKLALDGVPSHREPGSVSLGIVLRGRTHVSRKKQKSWPRAFNSTLLIGDVTGDGLSDLLLGHHPQIMAVHVGVPEPDLFDGGSQEVAVAPPNDEEYTWLVDLNEDGKQDLLMHHPFTLRDAHGARRLPLGTEPHQVTMLIAR